MIKCEDNKVSICGTKRDLIIELMMLIHSIVDKGVASRDEIMEYVIFSLMTNREVEEMIVDTIDNMDDIGTALNLLGMLEHEKKRGEDR